MANIDLFPEEKYVIDTSSLIAVHQEEDDRAEIWEGIYKLIRTGRLHTVKYAFDELEHMTAAGRFSPDILEKLRELKSQFVLPEDVALIKGAGEIVFRNPQVDDWRDPKNEADPWLIAAAKQRECKLVTEERDTGPKRKKRIPWVCEQEKVKWIRLRHLVENEKLLE